MELSVSRGSQLSSREDRIVLDGEGRAWWVADLVGVLSMGLLRLVVVMSMWVHSLVGVMSPGVITLVGVLLLLVTEEVVMPLKVEFSWL